MILPDPFPVFNSSQDDIQDITPERRPVNVQVPETEKVQEPEKDDIPEITPERSPVNVQELEKENMQEPEKEKEKTPRTRVDTLATGRSVSQIFNLGSA